MGDIEEPPITTGPVVTKCGMCKEQDAKYKCPRCQFETCSVACCTSHKVETGCSGKRSRTEFCKMSQFCDGRLLSDYTMLEEMSRATDSAHRRLKTLGGWAPMHNKGATDQPPVAKFSNGNVDQPLGTVVKRFRRVVQLAKTQNINLVSLPLGMGKQKRNTTVLHAPSNKIRWRLEWKLPASDVPVSLFEKRVEEDVPLGNILAKYLDTRPDNVALRHQLTRYCAAFLSASSASASSPSSAASASAAAAASATSATSPNVAPSAAEGKDGVVAAGGAPSCDSVDATPAEGASGTQVETKSGAEEGKSGAEEEKSEAEEVVPVRDVGLQLFMLREFAPGGKTAYYRLDPSLGLRENLAGKTVVEYPVISVVVPGKDEAEFPLVEEGKPGGEEDSEEEESSSSSEDTSDSSSEESSDESDDDEEGSGSGSVQNKKEEVLVVGKGDCADGEEQEEGELVE